MATNNNNGLQHLKGSDYEIKDGEPDIRGWDARNESGNKIGTIKDLIFDAQAHKVRYMVVDTDKAFTSKDSREVLVPIGIAQLHNADDDAILPGVTAEQLNALPAYKNDTISREDESAIRDVFAGLGVAGAMGAAGGTNWYAHEHFNEDNLFKNRNAAVADESTTIPIIEEELQTSKRTVETGGAYIKSRIVETPVEETVNLTEEKVVVNRTPVDRPLGDTDFDAFDNKTIELTEYAEVPVVSKEARVVEEVNIGKEVNERTETIHDTVRKTEVDIERLDDDSNDTSLRNK